MFDELKILITGDTTGIESSVRKALNIVTGGVEKMNDETVDWTGIFSRAVSPAIISGVAAVFATAIASAVSFQDAFVNAGQNSQNAFGQNASALTSSVVGISDATGQAASDVATNMAKLVQLFGNDTPTAVAAMNEAAQIATATGMSLGDVVNLLIPVFDNWGLKTVPDVTGAITSLFEAAKTGKIGFSDLAQAAAEGGVALRDKTNIKDTVFQLEQLSNQSGMTAQGTISSFESIAKGMQDPLSQLVILSGGFSKLSGDINKDGIVGAFEDVKSVVRDAGSVVGTTLGKQMGLVVGDIQQIQALSPDAFKAVQTGAQTAEANAKDLNTEFNQSLTFTKELGILWNVIFNALGQANLNLGKFIQDLAKANSLSDIVNVLGGPLQYQTTPAVAADTQTYPGFSANGPQIPAMANSPANNTTTVNNTQNSMVFNLSMPSGSTGTSTSPSDLSRNLYNAFQGIK